MEVVAPAAVLDYASHNPLPGLPPQTLRIKVGGIYRLMRNLSIDRGMVKNSRCVVTGIGQHLISVRMLHGHVLDLANDEVLIPRITFSTVLLTSRYTLLRKQFPLTPAYATTFNSCQGMTLDKIGIDLTRPVFSHGQLYTALSRVRHRSHARVRLGNGEHSTENVTFTELLI
ncbi:hypothetical protein M422DRAFT_167885 [Sphaerobolus stellatus SS14]|uniref:ATP-dependent DNA helicase n=1 Tax=Sphaerobolus stellatus (strain SS14) TaxID=990650 RepID=A0A0C9VCB7_SPHS4|nr:hypothetical protein M422DRAFT_167885 [Sphaerobolus stellatus SS14]